nr:MAG TPA: hypothetical protein [Caudoviricetes sp.]
MSRIYRIYPCIFHQKQWTDKALDHIKKGYITPIQPFKSYIILCSIINKTH